MAVFGTDTIARKEVSGGDRRAIKLIGTPNLTETYNAMRGTRGSFANLGGKEL
jgi:hypothetical protein